MTLLAESGRSIASRSFLARTLGWTDDRLEAVDFALRAIRAAATKRTPLVLCGESDLAPTAFAIHRITHGSARPFVFCRSSTPRNRRVGSRGPQFPAGSSSSRSGGWWHTVRSRFAAATRLRRSSASASVAGRTRTPCDLHAKGEASRRRGLDADRCPSPSVTRTRVRENHRRESPRDHRRLVDVSQAAIA